jgi:hypothetical protein
MPSFASPYLTLEKPYASLDNCFNHVRGPLYLAAVRTDVPATAVITESDHRVMVRYHCYRCYRFCGVERCSHTSLGYPLGPQRLANQVA